MNLDQSSSRRPSILKDSHDAQEGKPRKRTSFTDEVKVADHLRRTSGLSVPASDHTTDDSNKSADTFDFRPRTSSFPNNRLRADKGRTSTRVIRSDSTISSRSGSGQCGVQQMRNLVKSKFWKIMIGCFTAIMIFGGPMENFFPVTATSYFSIIFSITFAVLIVDIVLMCYTTPMYFVFRPSMKLKKRSDEVGCLCFSFQIGSFLFWFDVISVISLLFQMPNIVQANAITRVMIHVNNMGVPINMESSNSLSIDATIFTIILSTARVARLLRVDYVTALQSWTANMTKSICRRNEKDSSGSFGRKFFKDSHNDTITEERLEQMHEAATKIQRAWKNQSTLDEIRAFQIAGVNHATSKKRYPSFRQGSFKVEEDIVNQNTAKDKKRNIRQFTKQSVKDITSKAGKESMRALRFIHHTRFSETSASLKGERRQKRSKSHIGSAMNEMTMRRVAVGMMISISLTAIFTYAEPNKSREITVVSMHNAMASFYKADPDIFTDKEQGINEFLHLQMNSSTPDMVSYEFHAKHHEKKEINVSLRFQDDSFEEGVREWEKVEIEVCQIDSCDVFSKARFARKNLALRQSWLSLVFIFFLLLVWSIGLLFFVGPVTTLVVYPIERMIRLLSMLVKDPLGYSKSKKYGQFVREHVELANNTTWTRECLNGMETSFLMSTILRIGSLMKVGFGSAGVDIIRSNLQKSTRQSISLTGSLKRSNSTVACIFMFCDIRGFTDSSECLNEEVFVFTNRIAAVVHSYCHAYGGSANKNIGDAFLLSWKLCEPPDNHPSELYAGQRQADKALLSVVKICMALYHESFFLEGLSKESINALKKKFAKRPGNLVQLGFGLHAGKAVEGAIGSQRKLDATYLSEAVELAEYLESSTKKYGVSVLMSGKFYSLLHKTVREKCRKIDHICFTEQYEDDDPSGLDETNAFHMSLHTFDTDIDSLFKKKDPLPPREISQRSRKGSIGSSRDEKLRNSSTSNLGGSNLFMRRMSMMGHKPFEALQSRNHAEESVKSTVKEDDKKEEKKLEIPDGNLMYSHKAWHVKELLFIRKKFTPAFYEKFNAGYEAYIRSDWKKARRDFEYMVSHYNDKPSQVFLDKMNELKDKPPQNFRWRYDIVSMEYH